MRAGADLLFVSFCLVFRGTLSVSSVFRVSFFGCGSAALRFLRSCLCHPRHLRFPFFPSSQEGQRKSALISGSLSSAVFDSGSASWLWDVEKKLLVLRKE